MAVNRFDKSIVRVPLPVVKVAEAFTGSPPMLVAPDAVEKTNVFALAAGAASSKLSRNNNNAAEMENLFLIRIQLS